MKLGLILECPRQGTDHQVYEYVISQLCPGIEVVVIPSGATNKPGLISKCGGIASNLFEAEHCDTVAIVWDLMPTWGGAACRKNDIEAITQNLIDNNVNVNNVKLICIEPELEGWLIVDGGALTQYKRDRSHPHRVRSFPGVTLPSQSNDAKKTISKYLGWRYNDITEARRIARHITNYDHIARHHKSFARLKMFIEQICPQYMPPECPIGQYAGKMRMSEDFSEPLPDAFWLGDMP